MQIVRTDNGMISQCGIREASILLGISEQAVRSLEADGKLIPCRTEGGHRRYSVSDIENLLQTGFGEEFIPIILNQNLQPLPETISIAGQMQIEGGEWYVDFGEFKKRHDECNMLPPKYKCKTLRFPSPERTAKDGYMLFFDNRPTENSPLEVINGVGQLYMSRVSFDNRFSKEISLKLPRILLGREVPEFSNSGEVPVKTTDVWYERVSINNQPVVVKIPEAIQIDDNNGLSLTVPNKDIEIFATNYAKGLLFRVFSEDAHFSFRRTYLVKLSYGPFDSITRHFTNISQGNGSFREITQSIKPSMYGFVESNLVP